MGKVAILALQGAFVEHRQMLRRLGVETVEIRQLGDWLRFYSPPGEEQGARGLVLPGGESTTQMRLLGDLGLLQPLRQAILGGLPVLGTCAGMILLSEGRLGTMDIRVHRNAWGRQLGSFHTEGRVEDVGDQVPMTFIRAPYIEEVLSDDCRILARADSRIVAARQGNQLALAFHPELDGDTRLHEYFLTMCREAFNARKGSGK